MPGRYAPMLLRLLRRPRRSFAELSEHPPGNWLIPIWGFTLVSFAEGYDRIVSQQTGISSIGAIGLTLLLALMIGSWTWAFIYGGALHASSLLLGGKPGPGATIRAVGYAFFWPGVLAFLSGVVVILTGYRGGQMSAAAMMAALFHVIAGFWALYLIISALKVRHSFSWLRAISAYLLPILALLIVVLIFLVILK